ncbi:MAG TPA: disulfide bond formation protein B [Alphaproteobacteria bacterium]
MERPTHHLRNLLSDAATAGRGIAVISALALATVLTAQYGFGLKPCELCHFQRVPYVAALFLGLLVLLLAKKGKPKVAAALVFLCALIFAAGSGLGFYHAGVEQHWWRSFLEGCKIDFSSGGDLLAQIEASAAVPCDRPAWVDPVIGMSMAAWNGIVSAGLAVGCMTSSILITRRANGF